MLKQHRELSMFVRHTIETNEQARIRSSKTYQSFVTAADSHRELSFIEKDVRNYITREVRNVSEQDDAQEFGKYLLRMKEKNQNFFFELNLEGDHSIKNAFWADARSRAACKYFGVVVSFDTTYNTNRYSVQSGYWFFCGRESPRLVDTSRMRPDEKREHPIIQMAIQMLALLHGREGTKRHSHRPMRIDAKGHRDVHANKNSPVVHLAHHEEDLKQTKRLQATRKNRTRDEPHCLELVHKRRIQQKIERFPHKVRPQRQQVALRFRSNTAHLFGSFYRAVRGSVHHTQQLIESIREAIRQLPSKQRAKREREREFDIADFHTVIPCATKSAIEVQFQHVYTHEKFRKVQGQLRGNVKCITRLKNSTLGFTTYEVMKQVSNSTFNKFFVTYDAVSREVKCQCLLFESRGILCRHSLSVLSFERVDNVAPKYILERWSKNIKRRHTHQEHPRRASTGAEKQEIRPFGLSVTQYMQICIRVRGAD
ncbi:protein FAR1-RELATED SEQUENCE 4-like [Arachis ipaensis]|uniref:protein FAR1-RELATED SEQUENCE 4-like n=1 Tax=Arachis ipaensis TaxID=130454 RepID=UPI0007AF89DE|nr:protein FAR1-RELATED SEQUENCE 4-like [Arachis ipaensis]XP_025648055.1 protein FAR1-RELATED SEQUENCE 4-like [Arachis hypogaea]